MTWRTDGTRRIGAVVALVVVFAAVVWWLVGGDDGEGVDVSLGPVGVVEGEEIEPPEVAVPDGEATELAATSADDVRYARDDDVSAAPPTGALDVGVFGMFRQGDVVVVGLRRFGDDVGLPFFSMRPPQRELVRHLPPGSYEVLVLPDDDVTGVPLLRGQATVRADDTASLTLTYDAGRATLRVRLLGDPPWYDELLGEPDVRLRRLGAPPFARDPADEDWKTTDGVEVMTIPDLAPGVHLVDVAPFGIEREAVLVDGETTDVDIALDDLAWIVARPTDATGFVDVVWGFVGRDDAHVVPQAAGEATWAVPPRPIWIRTVGQQSSSDTITVAPIARETSDVVLVCDRPPPPTLIVEVSAASHPHVVGEVFVGDTEIAGPGRVLVSSEEFSGLRNSRVVRHVVDRPGTYTLRHVVRLGETLEDDVDVRAGHPNSARLELPRR